MSNSASLIRAIQPVKDILTAICLQLILQSYVYSQLFSEITYVKLTP